VVKSSRGASLLELLVALSLFGAFLVVIMVLQREVFRFDRELQFQWRDHVHPAAVASRLQRDVRESSSYPASFLYFTQSSSTLLLRRSGNGPPHTIVYEFEQGLTRRREYKNDVPENYWEARGVPQFVVSAITSESGNVGVGLTGIDARSRIIIENAFFPRAR